MGGRARNVGSDRSRVSSQEHEIEHIHRQFPEFTYEQIRDAIAECKTSTGSVMRDKVIECLRSKYGK